MRTPLVLLLFFFQAEDGIRDLTVTGVQTCALPISSMRSELASRLSDLIEAAIAASVRSYTESRDYQCQLQEAEHIGFVTHELRNPRSEERRVGKECRSRWSPYH